MLLGFFENNFLHRSTVLQVFFLGDRRMADSHLTVFWILVYNHIQNRLQISDFMRKQSEEKFVSSHLKQFQNSLSHLSSPSAEEKAKTHWWVIIQTLCNKNRINLEILAVFTNVVTEFMKGYFFKTRSLQRLPSLAPLLKQGHRMTGVGRDFGDHLSDPHVGTGS